jgi:hypothetical protein
MIYSTGPTWRLDADRQAGSALDKTSRKPLNVEILNFCVCALSQKDGTPCHVLNLSMHENRDVYVGYGVVIFVGSIRPLFTDADGLRHRLYGLTFFDVLFLPGSLVGMKNLLYLSLSAIKERGAHL